MNIKGIFASLLAGSALIFSGCNSSTSSGGGTPVTANDLIGTWNFTTGAIHDVEQTNCPGVPVVTDIMDEAYTFTDTTDRITLNADSTYSLQLPLDYGGGMGSGTWSVSGNTLTLVRVYPSAETTIVTVSISGSTLNSSFTVYESGTDLQGCPYSSTRTITSTNTKRP